MQFLLCITVEKCEVLCHMTGAYLGAECHKLGVDLVVVLIQRAHVLGVGDEPIDGREVLALCKFFVQAPEHLHDAKRGRGHGVREVSTRGRHAAGGAREPFDNSTPS